MTRLDDSDELFEVERYELREPPRYRFDANRREFVQVLGTGLLIAAAATRATAQQRGGRARRGGRAAEQLSDRFHFDCGWPRHRVDGKG